MASALRLFVVAVLLASCFGFAIAQENRVLSARPGSALAVAKDHRVALVIGNSSYAVGPLKNPVNDAQDVAGKLRQLGFDVVDRSNLKTSQIGRTLREFRSKLSAGSVALVFYAGHGLQIKGENYLPTVDADIEGEEDVANQSLSLRQLLEMLDESKTRLNLVFLDACRNNPFSRKFRSASDGLARVMAPSGTLISYATRPGSVASDGDGRNGLYTTQLLQVMEVANQPIEQALKRVVSGVKSASKGQQEPWMEGSIEGDFYFIQRAEPITAAAPAADSRTQQDAIDRAVQEAVRRANEQAAREKTEQQAAAVQDAVRRANEQAAKERAELQASMEKLIRQALAEQNARIDAERRANQPVQSAVPSPPTASPAKPATQAPQQLAMAAPTATQIQSAAAGDGPSVEAAIYRSMSVGKAQRLIVTTASPGNEPGVHEIRWANGPPQEFDSRTTFVAGGANEGGILFAPRWKGKLDTIDIAVTEGTGYCAGKDTCKVSLKRIGEEKLTVAAGSFDAIKLEGWIRISSGVVVTGTLNVWYSKSDGRLLKQEVNARHPTRIFYAESLELESMGTVRRQVDGLPVILGADLGKPGNADISVLSFDTATVGDEWEYLVVDNILGNKRRVVRRVAAVAAGKGVLEELLVDGRKTGHWVADGTPALVGVSSEIEPLFVPFWKPGELGEITIANWGGSATLKVKGRILGTEKIAVPAGSYDTVKIGFDFSMSTGNIPNAGTGHIEVWYSEKDHRVIRQTGRTLSPGGGSFASPVRFNDTIELSAVRATKR